MSAKGDSSRSDWIDPDDPPFADEQWFEEADVYFGDKLISRGRRPGDPPKQPVSLRLDADILAKFRADGPGWQTRINDALRKAVRL